MGASIHELEDLRARLEREIGVGAGSGLVGHYIDEATNSVVLAVRESQEGSSRAGQAAEREPYARAIGVGIGRTSSIPSPDNNCETFEESCNPIRGGAILEFQSGSNGCTMGFYAEVPSTGARRLMTAGHCSNSARYHSGSVVGSVLWEQESGSIDGQLLSVATGWARSNFVIHNSTSQNYRILARNNTFLMDGIHICQRGYVTNLQCSEVVDGDYDGEHGDPEINWTDMLITADCSIEGDSGGPVYASGTAMGIMRGYQETMLGGCLWSISTYTFKIETATGVRVFICC